MRSARTKACDISQKVKFAVWERDGERCIICGSHIAMPNSHYIKRSQGGLGIEENITTMCLKCHDAFDGAGREAMKSKVAAYLKSKYPGWDESKLIYKKGVQKWQ